MTPALNILIESCVQLGATQAMVNLGLSSGEMSQRKCRLIYGKWFVDADRSGRIRPCRVENGKTGTRWYRVTEILSLKASDAAKAELI